MPHATCSVCKHPEIEAIEQAIASGGSVRVVARRFGLTHAAVGRHRLHEKSRENRINFAQIARIDKEIKKLNSAERHSKKKRDTDSVLKISRELRNWLTLRAKYEAITGARQAVETADISPAEALALARTLIENSLSDADVCAWLRSVAERTTPTSLADTLTEESSERD
jgi:hypothetical protein